MASRGLRVCTLLSLFPIVFAFLPGGGFGNVFAQAPDKRISVSRFELELEPAGAEGAGEEIGGGTAVTGLSAEDGDAGGTFRGLTQAELG